MIDFMVSTIVGALDVCGLTFLLWEEKGSLLCHTVWMYLASARLVPRFFESFLPPFPPNPPHYRKTTTFKSPPPSPLIILYNSSRQYANRFPSPLLSFPTCLLVREDFSPMLCSIAWVIYVRWTWLRRGNGWVANVKNNTIFYFHFILFC